MKNLSLENLKKGAQKSKLNLSNAVKKLKGEKAANTKVASILPEVISDIPMPDVKLPKNSEEGLKLNMTPGKCVDCISFKAVAKDTLVGSCYYYPPVPFDMTTSLRPKVNGGDLACSKFKRRLQWE